MRDERAETVRGPVLSDPADASSTSAGAAGTRRVGAAAIIALVVGLLVTAALSITSLVLYENNEDRLLKLRLRELDLVLSATSPAVQTPLASAAALAQGTAGNAQSFRAFMAPYVGPGREFLSVSIWKLGGPRPVLAARLGAPPLLARHPQALARFLAGRPGVLNLTGILEPAHPALGFEFTVSTMNSGFAAYAENLLPPSRRSKNEGNSAFSDLNYALYLGQSRRRGELLVTNASSLPLHGRQATDAVPFGAGRFTLVVSPKGSLSGAFSRDLTWIVGAGGVLIALAAALTTERIARGRRRAERLARDLDRAAGEISERYQEQQGINRILQQALLPAELPELAGVQASALYVPASSGVDVGGDWYDVVEIGAGRVLLIIGDVSGHGLEAATTMALLRHATLAYAVEDSRPAGVLEKLSEFAGGRTGGGSFATVLCAQIALDSRRLSVASAGHLAPLLLVGERADFVDLARDAAIGVRGAPTAYRESVSDLPPSATLIAYTDGLVERRNEVIDTGLKRLQSLATASHEPLADLLATLARELTSAEHHDDTAIVGVRWER